MDAAPGPGSTWTRGRRALQQWLCRARLASVPAVITAKTHDFRLSALQKPRLGRHARVEITVCPHGRGCMKSVQGFSKRPGRMQTCTEVCIAFAGSTGWDMTIRI